MRTVESERNVNILVGWDYGNRDVFEEAPCWWLRTRRCVFLSGFFPGRESATLHDRSCSGQFWCALLFPLKKFGNIVEYGCRLSETFLSTKTDSCSSCRTRGSITCITRIRICLFAPAEAFCILSNSVTRNEIMSIGALKDNYWNQIPSSYRQIMRFDIILNPIGR